MRVERTPPRASKRLRGESPEPVLLEVRQRNPVAPIHRRILNREVAMADKIGRLEDLPQNGVNPEGGLPNVPAPMIAPPVIPPPVIMPQVIPLQVIAPPAMPPPVIVPIPEVLPQEIPPAANPPQIAPPAGPNQNLDLLLQALNLAPPVQLPLYSGLDLEDPRKFLTRCQIHFRDAHVHPNAYTRTAITALRGEAEKWWTCYEALEFDWDTFQNLLLCRFDNAAILSRLHAQLFSRKQGDRENSSLFLQQKYLLYQRLRGGDPEVNKVTTLLELLRPNLRMAIRPYHPQTLSELMTRVLETECDLAELTPRIPKRDEPKSDTKAPPKSSLEGPKNPKCWHCPEYHLNKDCPVRNQRQQERENRPSENWRRAAEIPAPVANQNHPH